MLPPTNQIIHKQEMQSGKSVLPAGKVTKVRRTRQPKNPQLSVARRNERERNRVKMVNNGFALLREHLPIEDLQDCCESGSDTPTPDGQKGGQKPKKYSKVETLRAAIQRIRMLEELIRSTEPSFQSINIMPNSNANSYDDEPLSCGSSASPATTTTTFSSSTLQQSQVSQLGGQQYQLGGALVEGGHCAPVQQLYATNQQGQFIKLEPNSISQQQTGSYTNTNCSQLPQMPSPQDSHHSRTSLSSQSSSQVQHTTQYSFQVSDQLDPAPSHTHLWIQQHQSSFMEHQQQMAANNDWFQQQQQQQQQQHLHQQAHHHQQFHHLEQPEASPNQQQQQLASPVWFNSPSSQHEASTHQPSHFNQHQVSLYSQ